MISRRATIWAAGLVFALTLIANVPAALLYAAFKPKQSALTVHGLQGPWAAGQLSGISQGGRLLLQDLRWYFKPWWLPLGRAAVHIEGGGEIATLQGELSQSPATTRLSDFRIAGSVRRLAGLANMSYLPLDGQAGADLDSLVLKKGFIDSVTGTLNLSGLAWTLAREPMPLGDFQFDIVTTPEAVIATASSPSGPLEVAGDARLLPDRSWELKLRLKPRPGASETLLNYLRSLGNPDAEGYYPLRQQGRLS